MTVKLRLKVLCGVLLQGISKSDYEERKIKALFQVKWVLGKKVIKVSLKLAELVDKDIPFSFEFLPLDLTPLNELILHY